MKLNFMFFFYKKLPDTVKNQFIFLFFLISLLILYTIFHPIPTEYHFIGIGSPILDIGDRDFYINNDGSGYGFGNIKGGIIYPTILKAISKFTELLGIEKINWVWNLLTVLMTSIISITNLLFIDKSAKNIFGNKTAEISNWLYVLCPYTTFYSLSGGITMYMMLGSCVSTYLVSKSSLFKNNLNPNIIKTYIYLFLCILYLGLLRPTGSIYGLLLISILLIFTIKKINIGDFKIQKSTKYFIILLSSILTVICLYQLIEYSAYISFSIKSFSTEQGTFFGFSRQILRDKLIITNSLFESIKNILYLFLWRISEFVGGLSDIRDTFRNTSDVSFFPFIIRVLTGLFYLYPLNLLAFVSFFVNRKRIFDSGLWIILFASFFAISPSLLGVANSRYLIMVFPPILICAASLINIFFKNNLVKV